LYNQNGSRLNVTITVNEDVMTVDLSGLPRGIYMLNIVTTGTNVTKKVVKTR